MKATLDSLKDTVQIRQNLVTSEANYSVAFLRKKFTPTSIVISIVHMPTAIDPDDQFGNRANKIDYIRPEWSLSTKFEIGELTRPKSLPELVLRVR